jgi:tetratricopeptide (TPR) repeat protein
MNRMKGSLVILLCFIFQPGAFAQQTANEKAAEDHFKRGNEFQSSGNRDGAIAEYREAIRHAPNYADAHNNLGFALAAKGDLDGAIAPSSVFTTIIRRDFFSRFPVLNRFDRSARLSAKRANWSSFGREYPIKKSSVASATA